MYERRLVVHPNDSTDFLLNLLDIFIMTSFLKVKLDCDKMDNWTGFTL